MDDLDLTDLDRFAHGFPYDVFDGLRRDAPVWFHPATENTPGGEGFWVISRYADIVSAASGAATFSSESGPGRTGGGTLIEDLPSGFATGVLLNMMDDPRHQRFRRLLTPSLSPRTLRTIEEDLRQRAERIVETALTKGDCDFLTDIAAELPLQAVAQLLGVPQEDRHQLLLWADATLDHKDRALGESTERTQQAAAEMFAYGSTLLKRKQTNPTNDLLSVAANAHIDGAPLSDLEQQMLFNLLIAAGTETTRNALAIGIHAVIENPATWEQLQSNRNQLPTAVEEMLRWASPTPYNRRTATRDTTIADQQIRAGDKVTLWWASANRDEEIFPDPHHFDITRTPNPHLAFGRGSHFCLGAALARMEMRVVLDTLLDRVDSLELTAPIEHTRSNKHTGIRHMPVHLTPR
ncbi:cytochrome P450 [Actinomadura opuntiae]|uniref:cytochrome P450 n=1 Tax=Actinomadura sp. OS1-43 TaxID=604315 RepID=UPI00255AA884|nr:cytochrome P450 [Actinomadura sp. OS1-43]MDL4815999.1 cytochrome P450 [Actinomadura sp. OS1-43]